MQSRGVLEWVGGAWAAVLAAPLTSEVVLGKSLHLGACFLIWEVGSDARTLLSGCCEEEIRCSS